MIKDAEGYVEDEEVVANEFEDRNPAAAAQTNGADLEDMEEGEVEDEVHENGSKAEATLEEMSEVGRTSTGLSFVS